MVGVEKSSPYRQALISLINSINQEITLTEQNQVLLVDKLDTEEKIIKFNDWVKAQIKDKKFQATEAETMRAAIQISKEMKDIL